MKGVRPTKLVFVVWLARRYYRAVVGFQTFQLGGRLVTFSANVSAEKVQLPLTGIGRPKSLRGGNISPLWDNATLWTSRVMVLFMWRTSLTVFDGGLGP
jgi:hypothetical protein